MWVHLEKILTADLAGKYTLLALSPFFPRIYGDSWCSSSHLKPEGNNEDENCVRDDEAERYK